MLLGLAPEDAVAVAVDFAFAKTAVEAKVGAWAEKADRELVAAGRVNV